jgi:CDP-diacylglycerol--glycerol-3-phosphate 3-phosphatidyltransferase
MEPAFFAGGLVLILANVFDKLDGRVARLQGRATRFGRSSIR